MAETKMITFAHKEVAEALVKKENIHDGLWGIYIEFGIGAANVRNPESADLNPSAIVPVLKIGIQRFEEANNLTVDAAIVNPAEGTKTATKRASKARKRS